MMIHLRSTSLFFAILALAGCNTASKPQEAPSTDKAGAPSPAAENPQGGAAVVPASDTKDPYYCPMHPDKTSTDPNAKCPICGMKLEQRPKK
jgi:hypothetical protein